MNTNHSEIKEKKSRQTFEKCYKELSAFLKKKGRIPEKSERPILYNWMAALRNKHKRRRLKSGYADKLNAIGFIWDKREVNWYNNAGEVRKMLSVEKKFLPITII